MRDKKILIVGAGPSGLTLACELCRRGIHFQIIDKEAGPAPMTESRALAFNVRSQQILSPAGVTAEIKDQGHPINLLRLSWEGKLRRELDLQQGYAKSSPMPDGLISIRQGSVERLLQNYLHQHGCHVEWNTSFESVRTENSRLEIELHNADNGPKHEVIDTLIGCDGAHSQVRKLGGFSFDGESDPHLWSLADVTLKTDKFENSVNADLRPGKAFAAIALGNQQIRLIHNGPNLLDEHPLATDIISVEWESEFRVSYRMVKDFSRGNIHLCGDAAHIHSPVGGRGMNLGIEDAATLAFLISQNREQEYTPQRRIAAKHVIKQTHGQTTQLNSDSRLSSFMKKYGSALLSIGFIRQSMLTGMLGLDTQAPEWLDSSGREISSSV